MYFRKPEFSIVGFADAGYLLDPHKARSQTGYVFTIGGTAISWRSQKQTLVVTSSNHAETVALHEACRECVWLRSMSQHIQEASGIKSRQKYLKTILLMSLNSKKAILKATEQSISLRDFSHT